MNEHDQQRRAETDAELEREIRKERKFTLAEAIGRLAGPGAMKGASPIARKQQAEIEIAGWLRLHLHDPGGVLSVVLHRHVQGSDLLMHSFDCPLSALAECCERILASEYALQELVRSADVEWARTMDERPYFEQPGKPSYPDDPYTIGSVRAALCDLLGELRAPANPAVAASDDDRDRTAESRS